MAITGPKPGAARQRKLDALPISTFEPEIPDDIEDDQVAKGFWLRNKDNIDLQESDYDSFCLMCKLHSRVVTLEHLADEDPKWIRPLLDVTKVLVAQMRLFSLNPKDRRITQIKGHDGHDKDDFDF